ncbi:hypothetical protein KC19_2G175000 [Ceratodon purpureus]|uniref:Secreted protein n=1 Tax=Ceratodon purpureus TaxID=3225 RepID=A0A8T0IV19_CERPU|nr:hypothetical protein KC19_2G175000 [Ceratodon purpureus]
MFWGRLWKMLVLFMCYESGSWAGGNDLVGAGVPPCFWYEICYFVSGQMLGAAGAIPTSMSRAGIRLEFHFRIFGKLEQRCQACHLIFAKLRR